MKRKALLIIIVTLIIILASTWYIFFGRYDANMVLKIPNGFVDLQNNLKNGLDYFAFETQIVILDADGVGIYQTSFKNSHFIVKFKGDYYVNEEKILEIIDVATIASEQRNKVYHIGEEVEVRGAGTTRYTLKIVSLEVGETEPYYTDTRTTYRIKYITNSNIDGNEQVNLISSVETEYGVSYNDFNFIDSETISIKIRARGDDKIKAIILHSPDYPGLTYKIVVDE